MSDLFSDANHAQPGVEILDSGVVLLHGFALQQSESLKREINKIDQQSPYRQLTTPGGLKMSVTTTSCGDLGWHSDEYGYRYVRRDPISDLPWPKMPDSFLQLASCAAAKAGFDHYKPDACLINRYMPGNKMSLHQDKNELDFSAPIVSVSLGLPAVFMFGGLRRSDPVSKLLLHHGDVLVWGGPARLRFHGVMSLGQGHDPAWGSQRINLTFRKAG